MLYVSDRRQSADANACSTSQGSCMIGDCRQVTWLNRDEVADENIRAAATPCALSRFTAKQPRLRIASRVGLELRSETSNVGGVSVTLSTDEHVKPSGWPSRDAVVTTATPVGKQLMRSENAFTCESSLDPSPASTLTTGDLGNGRSCLYSNLCAFICRLSAGRRHDPAGDGAWHGAEVGIALNSLTDRE